MIKISQTLANNESFQTFILWIILLTALSLGLEAIPSIEEQYTNWFEAFFYISQFIFAFEIIVRIIAFTPHYRKFFSEFWNSFDFIIVVVSFLPGAGAAAPVARLLRVLRVLRIMSVSDRLRGFLERMENTLDELCYSGLIIAILGYIFTISGHYLFSEIDPTHWGSLGRSALSVFYLFLFQNIAPMVENAVSMSYGSICYFLVFYFVIFSLVVNVIAAISHEHLHKIPREGKND